MKRRFFLFAFSLLALTLAVSCLSAREYQVCGPQGGLALDVTLPENFDPLQDKCPMVILMHGIFASKDYIPMPQIAKALAEQGIASIRFDFDGHGHSEGKMEHMTVLKEIEDARAIYEYVSSLPYVSEIALLGHSQGGVVASMFAGILASEGRAPSALVLMAPGTVIKEACQNGRFFNIKADPKNPPETVRCFGLFKLGREYMLTSQTLEIYETAEAYRGPVCIIHGDKDKIVPLWCSEKFLPIYDSPQFHMISGENHRFTRKKKQYIDIITDYFRDCYSGSLKSRQ